MGAPTRYPNGVTNTKDKTCSMMPILDPTMAHVFMDDFDVSNFNNITDTTTWNITATGTGTIALTDGDGGKVLLTNATADNDKLIVAKIGESFKFEAGKKLWYKAKFAVSDATESDLFIGLMVNAADPVATPPVDGVYFTKADGAVALTLEVAKNSTATSTAVGDLSDATDVIVGYYYNGVDAIDVFLNDVKVGSSVVTNLPDDEDLTIYFMVQNGEAAAKTLTVDYIFACKER